MRIHKFTGVMQFGQIYPILIQKCCQQLQPSEQMVSQCNKVYASCFTAPLSYKSGQVTWKFKINCQSKKSYCIKMPY